MLNKENESSPFSLVKNLQMDLPIQIFEKNKNIFSLSPKAGNKKFSISNCTAAIWKLCLTITKFHQSARIVAIVI